LTTENSAKYPFPCRGALFCEYLLLWCRNHHGVDIPVAGTADYQVIILLNGCNPSRKMMEFEMITGTMPSAVFTHSSCREFQQKSGGGGDDG